MIFVDTGYLLAVVNPRDELYDRAQQWARIVSEPLVTTEYVILELMNSFSDPIDRPKAHAVFDEISRSPDWKVIWASPPLLTAGLLYHRQHADKSWSLTDCISFVVMQQQKLQKALAFDRHFEQAGFDALLRRDP